MNYQQANTLLQGRCRERRKLANNTYLIRHDAAQISVRLHATNILTFAPDGTIAVSVGDWDTVTTKYRLNRFLPQEWNVRTGGNTYGPGSILYHNRKPVASLAMLAIIHPNGKVTGNTELDTRKRNWRNLTNENRRRVYKARYWILKARRGGTTKKPLTPDLIQAEQNITIRTAMIKVYGIERFLTAIGAKPIDWVKDYELISYSMDAWNRIRALKMVCPSTGAIYIHPVAPTCATVSAALDWMFQTKDYLGRLTSEA